MRSTALAVLSLPLLVACSGTALECPGTRCHQAHGGMVASGPGVAVVPAAASSTSASPAAPVLAEIRFRDHVLVIRSGARDGDLRYDVQDRAGQLLARSLTRGELGRRFPAIAEQFRDSTALRLDASLGATSGRENSREAPPRR